MKVTNWSKKKAKSSITIQITANVLLGAIFSFFQTPTIVNKNTFFPRLFSIVLRTINLQI